MVDGCDVIIKFKEDVKKAIKDTKEKGVEHGFDFIEEEGEIKIGKKCVGTFCEIFFPEIENKIIGRFHTHPAPGFAIPSPRDIISAIHREDDFTCIYAEEFHKLYCYNFDKDSELFKEDKKTLDKLIVRANKRLIKTIRPDFSERKKKRIERDIDEKLKELGEDIRKRRFGEYIDTCEVLLNDFERRVEW